MANYDLSTVSNLFKTVYGKLSEKIYNSENILMARTKKDFSFTGTNLKTTMPKGFGGSVGSGALPVANNKSYLQMTVTPKKVYARMNIDRESMMSAKDDKGSFVRLLQEAIKNTVESYSRNMERILFNDGTGALGTMSGANSGAGSIADPYLVTVSTATWKEANFEEDDYVNIGTVAGILEVVSVNPATKVIGLVTITGSNAVSAGDTRIIYMQGSKDNDPLGLEATVGTASGSVYGIDLAAERRWRSYRLNAAAAEISPDILNKAVLNIHKKCGKYPNLALTSYTQYIKLQNQMEDLKYIEVSPRDKDLQGKIGFKAIDLQAGPARVPVLISRFCNEDDFWLLNDNHIEIMHRPGFGWFDDDGTVLLRQADSDGYEARYGGYLQVVIKPAFQGQIHNLAL